MCGRCCPEWPIVGAGSEISEGVCSVWDHSVRPAVCVRADFTTVTRVNGCCAGAAETVPRRKWRSNQVGSGAVDSRPVATLKRENTGIRRHRWVRSHRFADDELRWRRADLCVWSDEQSFYDILSRCYTSTGRWQRTADRKSVTPVRRATFNGLSNSIATTPRASFTWTVQSHPQRLSFFVYCLP